MYTRVARTKRTDISRTLKLAFAGRYTSDEGSSRARDGDFEIAMGGDTHCGTVHDIIWLLISVLELGMGWMNGGAAKMG